MPSIAEAISERLVLKALAATSLSPSTLLDPATDPSATGGQIWRHVSHNLSLTRDTYSPNEMRTDQVQPIDKLGTKRVPVTTNHLLSCLTHEAVLEAVLAGTWSSAAIAVDNTDMTSVAADNATSKFTFGGGAPVTEGFRVGDIIQFTDLSEAANNSINFLILGFGGTSNREVTVYPAPTDMTADSAFSVTTVGRSLIAPSSSLVRRFFAIEAYNPESDLAKLYNEVRFGGFNLQFAPNQDARIDFTGMGRARYTYETSAAPFFTAPSAETTSDVISSMDGILRANGASLGGVTGLTISYDKPLSAPAQINNAGTAAGVAATGNAILSGEFTLFEADATFHDLYDAATEFELLAMAPETIAADSHAMVFYLPRIKIIGMTQTTIDGVKALTCRYSGSRYLGSAAGVESTPIRIVDTRAS